MRRLRNTHSATILIACVIVLFTQVCGVVCAIDEISELQALSSISISKSEHTGHCGGNSATDNTSEPDNNPDNKDEKQDSDTCPSNHASQLSLLRGSDSSNILQIWQNWAHLSAAIPVDLFNAQLIISSNVVSRLDRFRAPPLISPQITTLRI